MSVTATKDKICRSDVIKMMERYGYTEEMKEIIENENLLPTGLIKRLDSYYPQYSNLHEKSVFIFNDKEQYSGLKGFKEITKILNENGIDIGYIKERELFIEVYRFLATKHILNQINWNSYDKDSLFQLVFPQPGMINAETVKLYSSAKTDEERTKIVEEYTLKTNPHDGKQQLNKPWFENEKGEIEILSGSQHKYPPIQLIFDKLTQSCFAYCNYCFRHAQVRGDEDMFIQRDIEQVHNYLRRHKEITDVLITGGDAGYITFERLEEYITPIIEDPELIHIKTLRLGSRLLSYNPDKILRNSYNNVLQLFKKLGDNGIQILWMSHFSTPREILNPSTIAAIRRLRAHGVTVKSQSPIMRHISLFEDENGEVDVDRSAQNWIDLGNILAMLSVGFHSMYCARPTGEHHYFTAPLKDIHAVFNKVYKTLSSINRPSRFITMTSSAGKISLIGVLEVKGEKAFVLKFNEARNMDWMDKVFLAKYDEKENTIEKLEPFENDKYYFSDELDEVEHMLTYPLQKKIKS